MKRTKQVIFSASLLSIIVFGILTGFEETEYGLMVEKRIGEQNEYIPFEEVKGKEQIQSVRDLLDNVSWEDAEVSMAYPPHLKFRFDETAENGATKSFIYHLWISPNADKVELVIAEEGKYAQLDRKASAKLFEAITGEGISSP